MIIWLLFVYLFYLFVCIYLFCFYSSDHKWLNVFTILTQLLRNRINIQIN